MCIESTCAREFTWEDQCVNRRFCSKSQLEGIMRTNHGALVSCGFHRRKVLHHVANDRSIGSSSSTLVVVCLPGTSEERKMGRETSRARTSIDRQGAQQKGLRIPRVIASLRSNNSRTNYDKPSCVARSCISTTDRSPERRVAYRCLRPLLLLPAPHHGGVQSFGRPEKFQPLAIVTLSLTHHVLTVSLSFGEVCLTSHFEQGTTGYRNH